VYVASAYQEIIKIAGSSLTLARDMTVFFLSDRLSYRSIGSVAVI